MALPYDTQQQAAAGHTWWSVRAPSFTMAAMSSLSTLRRLRALRAGGARCAVSFKLPSAAAASSSSGAAGAGRPGAWVAWAAADARPCDALLSASVEARRLRPAYMGCQCPFADGVWMDGVASSPLFLVSKETCRGIQDLAAHLRLMRRHMRTATGIRASCALSCVTKNEA